MEAVPDSLYALMGIVEGRESAMDATLEHRIRAVSQLGDWLQRECLPMGMACLLDCVRQDTHPRLVTHVVGVLGRLRQEESVSVIIDVLLGTHIALYEAPMADDFVKSDDSMRLRCSAALALGKIGDTRAIIPMMSVLNNREENYRLRLAVAENLGRLGDDYAVKPLIEILADEREKSLYLKESVAKALGMLGDIRAIEPLIDMLESKRGIRDKFNFLKEQVIEAVGRIGHPTRKATDTLLQCLQDEASSIRLAAVEALSVIGDEDCLPPLKICVLDENDEVAKAAVYAVYRLGGEDAVRELLNRENLPQFLRDEMEGYIP